LRLAARESGMGPETADSLSVGGYLDSQYVLVEGGGDQCTAPAMAAEAGLSVPTGPLGGSPTRRVEIGARRGTRSSASKGARHKPLPVIAESASLLTPATSPNLPDLVLDAPPGMAAHGDGAGGPRDEVSELVLRLREERRGNLLLARRIKDLESVVREQETVLRETESKIPKTPLDWGKAALDALEGAPQLQSSALSISNTTTEGTENARHEHTTLPGAGGEVRSNRSFSDASCQTHSACQFETGPNMMGTVTPDSSAADANGMLRQRKVEEIEREETQAAKIGALQYKIQSLTQETELLRLVSDKREQKHAQDLVKLHEQMEKQDELVLELNAALEKKEEEYLEMSKHVEHELSQDSLIMRLNEALEEREAKCAEMARHLEGLRTQDCLILKLNDALDERAEKCEELAKLLDSERAEHSAQVKHLQVVIEETNRSANAALVSQDARLLEDAPGDLLRSWPGSRLSDQATIRGGSRRSVQDDLSPAAESLACSRSNPGRDKDEGSEAGSNDAAELSRLRAELVINQLSLSERDSHILILESKVYIVIMYQRASVRTCTCYRFLW
jgi:hypothetical protein